jgi:hypothetical protein
MAFLHQHWILVAGIDLLAGIIVWGLSAISQSSSRQTYPGITRTSQRAS